MGILGFMRSFVNLSAANHERFYLRTGDGTTVWRSRRFIFYLPRDLTNSYARVDSRRKIFAKSHNNKALFSQKINSFL